MHRLLPIFPLAVLASGAPHAFKVFTEDRYQQRADEKSWAAFQEFLDNVLAAGNDDAEAGSG